MSLANKHEQSSLISVCRFVSEGGVLKRRGFKAADFERWAIFDFLKC